VAGSIARQVTSRASSAPLEGSLQERPPFPLVRTPEYVPACTSSRLAGSIVTPFAYTSCGQWVVHRFTPASAGEAERIATVTVNWVIQRDLWRLARMTPSPKNIGDSTTWRHLWRALPGPGR